MVFGVSMGIEVVGLTGGEARGIVFGKDFDAKFPIWNQGVKKA